MKKEYIINNKKYVFDGEDLELYLVESDCDSNEKANQENSLLNSKNKVNKVVFNVANMCNLNCKYCYANGGNYSRDDNLMNERTATIIINSLKLKYDTIGTVYFFGGEPLLNFKLIEYVVKELENYYGKNIDFRTVTNATLMNNKIIDFLDKHNFKLYISLDGPKEIHELLRGKNTFEKIMENINIIKRYKLKDKTELLCTYTKKHDEIIGFEETVNFFEKIGLKYSITDVISHDPELKIDNDDSKNRNLEYIDTSINRIFNLSLNTGISEYLSAALNALVFHKKYDVFCKELCNDYSNVFDYTGEEYNCIRLVGKYNKNNPKNAEYNMKNNKKVCQKCIFKNLCTMCIADKLLGNEKFPFNNNECDCIEMYDYALKRIIEIYDENEDDMIILLNNYYGNYLK